MSTGHCRWYVEWLRKILPDPLRSLGAQLVKAVLARNELLLDAEAEPGRLLNLVAGSIGPLARPGRTDSTEGRHAAVAGDQGLDCPSMRLAASRLDEGKDRHAGIVREYTGTRVGSSEAAGWLPMISIPVRLFRRADRQPTTNCSWLQYGACRKSRPRISYSRRISPRLRDTLRRHDYS